MGGENEVGRGLGLGVSANLSLRDGVLSELRIGSELRFFVPPG